MENEKETRDAVARAAGRDRSLYSDSPFDSAAEFLAVAMSYWSTQQSATGGSYWWMSQDASAEGA